MNQHWKNSTSFWKFRITSEFIGCLAILVGACLCSTATSRFPFEGIRIQNDFLNLLFILCIVFSPFIVSAGAYAVCSRKKVLALFSAGITFAFASILSVPGSFGILFVELITPAQTERQRHKPTGIVIYEAFDHGTIITACRERQILPGIIWYQRIHSEKASYATIEVTAGGTCLVFSPSGARFLFN